MSDAHGMENGTDFVFYMPDTALDGLNSEFLELVARLLQA